MCNCAGNVQFSNCAGNPDCNCDKEGFNNMIGMNGFVNATGEIQTLSTPQIKIQTTVPTIEVKAPTTIAPTTSTKPTLGETIGKVTTFGSSLLGLFSKPAATTSAPVPLPEEEKTIPMAVWIVGGGLLVLVVVYFIVKASKK